MKRCPGCHRIYADDSLLFCLDDGTRLAAVSDPQATLRFSPRDVPPTLPYSRDVVTAKPDSSRDPGSTSSPGINPFLITTVIALVMLTILAVVVLGLFVKSGQGNIAAEQPSRKPSNVPSAIASPSKSNTLAGQLVGKWKWGSEVREYFADGTGTSWDDGKKCHDFTYFVEGDVLHRIVNSSSQCSTGTGNYRISINGDNLQQVFIGNGETTQWKRQ
jgi:hypothetical protein